MFFPCALFCVWLFFHLLPFHKQDPSPLHHVLGVPYTLGLNLFRSKAFVTTITELDSIARAAKIEFIRMWKNGYKIPAATGMKGVLYANA